MHRRRRKSTPRHVICCAGQRVLVASLGGILAGAACSGANDGQLIGTHQRSTKRMTPIDIGPIEIGDPLPKHERERYDWDPGFDLNAPTFDRRNRPYIRARTDDESQIPGYLQTRRKRRWVKRHFDDDILAALPRATSIEKWPGGGGINASRVVFDRDDHAYMYVEVKVRYAGDDTSRERLLLYSTDRGETWEVYPLNAEHSHLLEIPASPEPLEEPPVLLRFEKKGTLLADDGTPQRFSSYGTMRLIVPRKTSNGLRLDTSVLVTQGWLTHGQLSGGSAQAVTKNGRTYLVWGKMVADAAAMPFYVAVFDRSTGSISAPVRVADARPPNDTHNDPGITIDSKGHLHVVTGARNNQFMYSRSKRPEDIRRWSQPTPTKPDPRASCRAGSGCQTYLSLVRDSKDTLHIVYGLRVADQRFGGVNYRVLVYQRKKRGKDWRPPHTLYLPPLEDRSVFRHSMTIDRHDNLFVSYAYCNASPPYSNTSGPRELKYRGLLLSSNGGRSWSLATSKDF